MKTLPLFVLLATGALLGGCRPQVAELSPTGDRVVRYVGKTLTVRSLNDGTILNQLAMPHPTSVSWSPDGRWMLADLGKETAFVDLERSIIVKRLPMTGPYSWRADGEEAVGLSVSQQRALFFHRSSGELLRSMPLPPHVTELVHLAEPRGLAVGTGDAVHIYRGGVWRRVPVPAGIDSLRYNASEDRLRWIRVESNKDTAQERWSFWSLGLEENKPTQMGATQRAFDFSQDRHRMAGVLSASLSPSGEEVGVLSVQDTSDLKVSTRYFALSEKSASKRTPREQAELKRLEPQLRIAVLATRWRVGEISGVPQRLEEGRPELMFKLAWSGDGRTLAVISDAQTRRVPPNPVAIP